MYQNMAPGSARTDSFTELSVKCLYKTLNGKSIKRRTANILPDLSIIFYGYSLSYICLKVFIFEIFIGPGPGRCYTLKD